ncbi:MAG: hypothetical protein JEY79_18630, partial [Pseudodesulfovibrio sp.]|nr:hypothetical protein [Pseudodesulfovibrio sp.]
MKKILLISCVVLIILFTACAGGGNGGDEPLKPLEVILGELGTGGDINEEGNAYEILDLTEFGWWSLCVKKDLLTQYVAFAEEYGIVLEGQEYTLTPNPLNDELLEVMIGESVFFENVAEAVIRVIQGGNDSQQKRSSGFTPTSEGFYLEKEPRNDTNLYEIGIRDYISLYPDKQSFIFDEHGTMIRPAYVKSTEENAYTTERYFNARSVAETEDAKGAMKYLKELSNYETYIDMSNPNRFRIDGSATEILPPDNRWRMRQIGTMGTLDGSHQFNIADDASKYTLSIDKDTLPST